MAEPDDKTESFNTRAAADRRSEKMRAIEKVRDLFREMDTLLTKPLKDYYYVTPKSEDQERAMNRDIESTMARVWGAFEDAQKKMRAM